MQRCPRAGCATSSRAPWDRTASRRSARWSCRSWLAETWSCPPGRATGSAAASPPRAGACSSCAGATAPASSWRESASAGKDHGASLVWAACARRNMAEPRRPWVVDALDAAGVALLNAREADRISRWVSLLASDLAWAVTPPSAFLSDPVLRPGEEHPWEARETREFGPLTRDLRENDAAGELLMRPGRPAPARRANPTDARRAAARLRSAVTKVATATP